MIKSNALFSGCGSYRYILERLWDRSLPKVLIIMLNPSTADAKFDDPTIKSCIRLCKSLDFGGFYVVNLFAYRATDPKKLNEITFPIGPYNDYVLSKILQNIDKVICAWGANKNVKLRDEKILSLIKDSQKTPYCFDITKGGFPKHPLYIKTGTKLKEYVK